MNRLPQKMSELIKNKRKALAMFVTAGYPTIDLTPQIVFELEKAGADIIELGIPFSDPIADGPVIQIASQVALNNGVTITKICEIVRDIRLFSNIPIVLMGYYNPIYCYGVEKFLDAAANAGVDGLVVADLPLEEADNFRRSASAKNISHIFLAAPTTSDIRLVELDNATSGFLYCVSTTGTTGIRNNVTAEAVEYLLRCKQFVKNNPILVGFGISSGADVRNISRYADGVIVGSSLIEIIKNNYGDGQNNIMLEEVRNFVIKLRISLNDGANNEAG
ncbi:MAG: tryptophan synthase subunit alpha [Bacteroidota bacterium]|nr:tryptophan synthase subunit alpha [Bacteroidota bacterium]